MASIKNMQEKAIYKELSKRIKHHRILYPMKQSELADKAMVSIGTIKRFEKGEDISFLNVIKVLKALDLDGGLEILVSDPEERPSVKAGSRKILKRVRNSSTENTNETWKWGDEK